MILILDNYDSFSHNLAQGLGSLGATVRVVRNDRLTPTQILALGPAGLVISPGPGTPQDAGISVALIRLAAGTIPILGVCLGHQSIAVAFGGRIIRAARPTHGKTSPVELDQLGLFQGLPQTIEAARYHSLTVEDTSLPDCFTVTARTDADELMGIRHNTYDIEGIQFHPESYLTPLGSTLLANFIHKTKRSTDRRTDHVT